MNATKGYFCLVQYCPDIARQEAANVGVVLFCPERQFIRAKVSEKVGRIRRFFGEDVEGYKHLIAMQTALVNRLEVERAEFGTLEHLQQFVATRANRVILTAPKPVKVFDPEQDLQALYNELVAEPMKPLTVQATIPLRKRLDSVLREQALKPYVRRKLEIAVPALRETVKIPYGYQNGRFNLIRPVEFKHQLESSVRTAACCHGMEGLTLFNHADLKLGALQLIIVGDFANAPANAEGMVHDIFAESKVRLFTPDKLDGLRQEILTHGKLAPVQAENSPEVEEAEESDESQND